MSYAKKNIKLMFNAFAKKIHVVKGLSPEKVYDQYTCQVPLFGRDPPYFYSSFSLSLSLSTGNIILII